MNHAVLEMGPLGIVYLGMILLDVPWYLPRAANCPRQTILPRPPSRLAHGWHGLGQQA
jgi:hypothetical protein